MTEPAAAGCRFCSAPLRLTFADLGTSPLANSFVSEEGLRQGETFLPLHAYVCEHCFLVQLEEIEAPEEIFSRLRLLLVGLRQLGAARARATSRR